MFAEAVNKDMNQMLAPELHKALAAPPAGDCARLGYEPSLRVAAATLSRTRSREITATTVVGVLGLDDAPTVENLVGEIAEEFGLESRLRLNVGTYSVRFIRMGE